MWAAATHPRAFRICFLSHFQLEVDKYFGESIVNDLSSALSPSDLESYERRFGSTKIQTAFSKSCSNSLHCCGEVKKLNFQSFLNVSPGLWLRDGRKSTRWRFIVSAGSLSWKRPAFEHSVFRFRFHSVLLDVSPLKLSSWTRVPVWFFWIPSASDRSAWGLGKLQIPSMFCWFQDFFFMGNKSRRFLRKRFLQTKCLGFFKIFK